MCSNQRNMLHHTEITMPQQDVKAIKIFIPSFIQQMIIMALLNCTRGVEINIK